MPEIHHQLNIISSQQKIFEAVSKPEGLNSWWTLDCIGIPDLHAEYDLIFPEPYHWKAEIINFEKNKLIEFKVIKADEDWTGQIFGFKLTEIENSTNLEFYQKTWKENNSHYRISNYCWALYLRLLKRYLELGEIISYKDRNN